MLALLLSSSHSSRTSPPPATTHRSIRDPGHVFWRRLARWGAAHGPEWFLRVAPPAFGLMGFALLKPSREVVRQNVQKLRGDRNRLETEIDVTRTFLNYAGSLAEALTHGTKNARMPNASIDGLPYLEAAFAENRGVILATAHTAGWETVGVMLKKHYDARVMMVMQPEPNEEARALHDEARKASGVEIVHIGTDALDALPLLRHVRSGGLVALQIDRAVGRLRNVEMLGETAEIPEGPLMLSALSGAPIILVLCARLGHRRYIVKAFPPKHVPRRPTAGELDAVAQTLADELSSFLRQHPTQWFHFGEAASMYQAQAQTEGPQPREQGKAPDNSKKIDLEKPR